MAHYLKAIEKSRASIRDEQLAATHIKAIMKELVDSGTTIENESQRKVLQDHIGFWTMRLRSMETFVEEPELPEFSEPHVYAELIQESDKLLTRLVALKEQDPELKEDSSEYEAFWATVREHSAKLAAAGRFVIDPEQRNRLRTKLQYWDAEVRMATGKFYCSPRLEPMLKECRERHETELLR